MSWAESVAEHGSEALVLVLLLVLGPMLMIRTDCEDMMMYFTLEEVTLLIA